MRQLQLGQQEVLEIDRRLHDFIDREKAFLRRKYTLTQLSLDVSIPLNKLSAFINEKYHMHYNDMINKYRIEYCLHAFGKAEWQAMKIEGIAKASGFSNRNTFTSAFKKWLGMSPSEYFANHYKS